MIKTTPVQNKAEITLSVVGAIGQYHAKVARIRAVGRSKGDCHMWQTSQLHAYSNCMVEHGQRP